jgi:sec-independent protein translocase protein TatC
MSESTMSLIEHLEELRQKIIKIILAVLLGTIISFVFFNDIILEIITKPIAGKDLSLVQLTVTEAFLTKLKVSVLTGTIITIPYTAWQIWSFVLPALYSHERKYIYMITPFSAFLFTAGIVFAYFVVLPLALIFFISQGGGSLVPMLSFARYVSFVLGFLLPFGLVFQLPLAVIFLTKIGVIDYKFLKSKRKYAILIIFIVAAVLTPPDVISQVLMAAPVLVLYEISILISWIIRRKKKKEEDEDEYVS